MENVLQNSPNRRSSSQVSLSCRHCKGFQKLKWRCMTCRFYVCENCKEKHSQIGNHIISALTDIPQYTTDVRRKDDMEKMLYLHLKEEVKKMKCPTHFKQTYEKFCKTCQYLMCSKCIQGAGHSGHKIVEIEKFVQELKDRNTDDLFHDGLSPTKYRENSLDDSGFFDATTNSVNTEERRRTVGKQERDSELHEKEGCHDSPEDYEIVHNDTTSLPMTVLHTVTTNSPIINFMASASKDEVWIGGRDRNVISKITIHKTKLFHSNQTNQINGYQPLDISVNLDGDLLFVCKFDTGIKIVKTISQKQNQVSDFKNFYPLQPICIHCSKRGDKHIWIGLTEGGPEFEPPQQSSRQVVELNETGEVININEFSEKNEKLFTLPRRIVSTTQDICVIDRLNRFTGRVISLNKSGHVTWKFNPTFTHKTFLPTDLETTSSRNIIICDSGNNLLHILNESGVLVSKLHLMNLKIEQPFSLNFDLYSGNLLIGTASDLMSNKKKAMMYEIDISGLLSC